MRFYRSVVGVLATTDTAVGLGTEPMHFTDEFGECGVG